MEHDRQLDDASLRMMTPSNVKAFEACTLVAVVSTR